VSSLRKGLAAAVGSYLLWGLFPLYWHQLDSAGPIEVLAHRIFWSFAVLVAVVAATGGFRWMRELGARRSRLLGLAAVLMTINWGVFIYAVHTGRVIEASLGYFINPLVSVALAVLVLGERLRPAQKVAVAIAGGGVLVLAVAYGKLPWIGLTLAGSFGTYGLVKKQAGVDGIRSLTFESTCLVLPAAAYLVWLEAAGRGTFAGHGTGHTLLLVGAGVVTATPLVLFGAAAIRIPLATLGLLQYINPVMQFVIGVAVYDEAMPPARLAGFVLIWLALVVLSADAVRSARDSAVARERGEPVVLGAAGAGP
jgi:chloramphenicol-sensitive protein RarD